jgi:alpha-N-arabinofuranosidase
VQAIDVTRGVRPSRPVLKAAWLASVTVVAVGTGAPALAQPRAAAVRATIDASRTYAPISPYVYGQFIEHIGGIVNGGLWAEMLDDRKFYHEVAPADTPPPPPTDRRALRRFTVVGAADSVVMDREQPYVGEHSPLVRVGGPEARGIRQTGLAVRRGRAYTGRVILRGDPGVRVTVALAWGSGPGDRSVMPVGRLSSSYKTFPLRFTADGDSDDAGLEITGTGAGDFRVGAVSLMPADNVEGFRTDATSALRQLRSGVYRFPGGNFVSAHEWREAIGERDRRPPVLDPAWNAVQANDVGTDEFMTLCRLLGVEPYITVNAGFGDAWSAAEYVEYMNGAATTRMGGLRSRNGHPQPYRVKYWGIGNEPWGEWQLGVGPLSQFVVKHKLFAKAMRRVDPKLTLVAGGAMPDTMTQSKQALRLGGKVVPDPLSPADWTGGLFLHVLDDMDMISEHFYSYDNQRFDLAKGDRVPVDPGEPLVEWMRQPANRVRAKYEAYQDYLERIPALRAKRVPIALSEWAYARMRPNSYKVVPAYAWVFHEMFRHSELYQMACFTFATSLVSSSRTEAVLNPAGLLFKLYRDHFGAVPVAVSGGGPPPPPRYPVGGEQPKVNAGSPTFPLDVAAAWTEDRGALTIAVINPTESEQALDLTVTGADLAAGGRLWRMAPATLDATITPGQKPEVEVEEQAVAGLPASGLYAPFSVSLYAIPVRQGVARPASDPVKADRRAEGGGRRP